MFKTITVTLAIIFAPVAIFGYPNGAPASTCELMKPQHGAEGQDSVIPYTVSTSTQQSAKGDLINITIAGGEDFKGLLLQVRNSNLQAVGTFLLGEEDTLVKTLACSGNKDSAITHNSRDLKNNLTVTWQAPEESGAYQVVVTVVKDRQTFWVAQKFDVIIIT